jgi:hypothetical protein
MSADPFKELLERAFSSARDSGKPDWNRMLVAVLRNRLLQLTNRSFKTQDLGAKSLVELVSRYSDLVAIDRTATPVVIEWHGPLAAPAPEAGRVRPDLWRAIIDLSSGLQYEWDVAAGYARPVPEAAPAHRLPTIDAATLVTWRGAFASAHASMLPELHDREHLRAWVGAALGRQGLPAALRRPWSDYLKGEVVARLTSWFHDSGYDAPDLFGAPIAPGRHPST